MTIELVYWDSDAFLGWFQAEQGKVDLCQNTLEKAQNREILIITSTLTIAEVLWMKGAPRLSKDKAEIVRKFFRHSYIRLKNVTRSIAEDAQGLVWDNSIKPKDAIHVATALAFEIPILETFDGDLIAKSGRIGTSPLIIRKPTAPIQARLAV